MPDVIRIADETYVLPSSFELPGMGVIDVNPLVIRAKEPVLVDTGAPVFRERYLEAAFSLLDPADVRWIFLSHDDRDHSGNIMQLLDLCPNAQLLTTFIAFGRMGEEFAIPLPRVRFLNDGESFSAGDRTLTAIRPPFYDAPGTRGLWDASTGVYYSVDSFGALVPSPCDEMADVPEDAYEFGFNWFNRINHPWHEVADPAKVDAQIDRVRRLEARTIVSYHGPAAHHRSAQLCDMLSAIPPMEPCALPTQADLEHMLTAMPAEGHEPLPAGV